jgi:hypothetical protein
VVPFIVARSRRVSYQAGRPHFAHRGSGTSSRAAT